MNDHEETADPKETGEIRNVGDSTAIGSELDLESVTMDRTGAELNPDQFPGSISRVQDPHAAALIFRSGKINCTGAESIRDVHEAIEIVFEKFSHHGIETMEDPVIEVQNIVM